MTTKAAEAQYLAEHINENKHRHTVVFNPQDLPLEELPCIYAFSNVPNGGDGQALAVAEDGHVLGSHWCSNESYVPYDLGVLEGARPDRQKDYEKHYPNGFQMVFVRSADVLWHQGIKKALALNAIIKEKASHSLNK